MAFIYQDVINVGIQILGLIGLGWTFGRFELLDQARFMPQVNLLILKVALPAFNLFLVGIRLDLQDGEAWKTLGAFLLWTVLVQGGIGLWVWLACKGDASEAGQLNMHLLMLNYGILGLVALQAVLGQPIASLALLTTVAFFGLQLPFTLAAFEWEKWVIANDAVTAAEEKELQAQLEEAATHATTTRAPSMLLENVGSGWSAAAAAMAAEIAAEHRQQALQLQSAREPPALAEMQHTPFGAGSLIRPPSGDARFKLGGGLAGLELADIHTCRDEEADTVGPPPALTQAHDLALGSVAAPPEGLAGRRTSGSGGLPPALADARNLGFGSMIRGIGDMRNLGFGSMVRGTGDTPLGSARHAAFGSLVRGAAADALAGLPSSPLSPSPLADSRQTAFGSMVRMPHDDSSSHPSSPVMRQSLQGGQGGPQGLQGLGGSQELPAVAGARDLGAREGGGEGGSAAGQGSSSGDRGNEEGKGNGFSCENRYCWWSNQDYHPHRKPLLHEVHGYSAPHALEPPALPSSPPLLAAPPPAPSPAKRLGSMGRGSSTGRGGGSAPTSRLATGSGYVPPSLLTAGNGSPAQQGDGTILLRMPSAAGRACAAEPPHVAIDLAPAETPRMAALSAAAEALTRRPAPPPPAWCYGDLGLGAIDQDAAVPTSADTGDDIIGPVPLENIEYAMTHPLRLNAPHVPPATPPRRISGSGFLTPTAAEGAAAVLRGEEREGAFLLADGGDASRCSGAGRGGNSKRPSVTGLVTAPGSAEAAPSSARKAGMVSSATARAPASGVAGAGTIVVHPPVVTSPFAEAAVQRGSANVPSSSGGRYVSGGHGGGGAGAAGGGAAGIMSPARSLQPNAQLGGGAWRPHAPQGAGAPQQPATTLSACSLPNPAFGGGGGDGLRRRPAAVSQGYPLHGAFTPKHSNINDLARVSRAALLHMDTDALPPSAQRQRQALVREATDRVLQAHGGAVPAFTAFVTRHPQLWHILCILGKNPMVWTMFISVIVSTSGLRRYLDPKEPEYVHALGWIYGMLAWLNALTIPLSLFANGAWLFGKRIMPQGGLLKLMILLVIKYVGLPFLMLGCVKAVGLDGPHGAAMTLVVLSPPAAANFAIAIQYGRGVEMVTLLNVTGVLILAPLLMAWVEFLNRTGLLVFEIKTS